MNQKTFSAKPADVERSWHIIDAKDQIVGKVAVEAARLLRGKHKPIFTPHIDTGDFVVIINADKVALGGSKATDKLDYRHSNYPGGLSSKPYGELRAENPRRLIEKAVGGMLPHTTLGRQQLTKLKVYAGPEHPHSAQKPSPYEITQVAQ